MSNISDALATAKAVAAASNSSTAVTAAPGSFSPPSTRVKMNASDFLNSARTNVNEFLKVDKSGMNIGKNNKQIVEVIDAEIKLSDLKFCQQIRYGQPPQYFKTYDGVKSTDGKPWTDVIAQAKSIVQNSSSNPYPTAEMVLTIVTQVKDVKGADVKEGAVGVTLGYTPPYTGAPELANLIKAIEEAGGNIDTSVAKVKVTSEAKTSGANTWGIVKFEFLELVS